MENLKELKLHSYEVITIEDKLVNEAWNEGVKKAIGRYILVVNDDIILYSDTIPSMIKALELTDNLIACPYFRRKDEAKIWTSNGRNIVGFCFMIRQKDKNMIFPIDPRLRLWFGDNWIRQKGDRKVAWAGYIYHRESQTIFSDEQRARCLEIIEEDKKQWDIIKKENEWL